MKATHVWGIIFAIGLMIFGAAYPVPEKQVTTGYRYDYTWADNTGGRYVGGDAYNYQMEASLKAGYVSGVLAMKSIAFVGGVLLLFLTLYDINRSNVMQRKEAQGDTANKLLKEILDKAERLDVPSARAGDEAPVEAKAAGSATPGSNNSLAHAMDALKSIPYLPPVREDDGKGEESASDASPARPVNEAPVSPVPEDGWECKNCGALNALAAKECVVCGRRCK